MDYQKLLNSGLANYSDITDDSREVRPGSLFVAGGGRELAVAYAIKALENGAKSVVGPATLLRDSGIDFIEAPEGGGHFGEIASVFFGHPSKSLRLLGVTGTCGKTTSTYILESIFNEAGATVGVIGTENYRYNGVVIPSTNTTPGAITLSRILRKMNDAGCDTVIMEVSSHALKQKRVARLLFDGAIFTNLSTEHQDIHPDMEDYFNSKSTLFDYYATEAVNAGKKFHACVNALDAYGARLLDRILMKESPVYRVSSFSLSTDPVAISNIATSGIVDSTPFVSSLVGAFNAENLLGAIKLSLLMGVPSDAISRGIFTLKAVPGRLQRLPIEHPSIFVDFAHKPGALDAVLKTVRPITSGSLRLVFGCGGRRDRAKRPEMAKIASAGADTTIITSDNLRGEEWNSILADILVGIPKNKEAYFQVIMDRRNAIWESIKQSKPEDTIVIAGRGTEAYLSTADANGKEVIVPFDDAQVAMDYFQQLNQA